jgi:hypothetical protein
MAADTTLGVKWSGKEAMEYIALAMSVRAGKRLTVNEALIAAADFIGGAVTRDQEEHKDDNEYV